MKQLERQLWQWIWLIGLAFIWGSSFILIKKGLISYSPEQVAAYRMFFAAILISPIAIKHLKSVTRKNWIYILEVAFIGNAIPAYLFSLGQTHISSTLAGILNSITPIATLIVGLLMFKAQATWKNILGLFIGLVGAIGLILSGNKTIDGEFFYSMLIVIAGIMYAFNLNIIKNMLQDLSGVAITSIAFLMTLPVSTFFLFNIGFGAVKNVEFANISLMYIFILATFSSAIAVIGFNILVKYTSAIFASSVTYIIPIFAVMWGLLDGESVQGLQVIGLSIIIAGIYLVNLPKSKKHV
ncbi:MAG: DMT family transporter [Bacteroidales bacterium]|nr:DMT family transporter [Bacteroidales bacterium]